MLSSGMTMQMQGVVAEQLFTVRKEVCPVGYWRPEAVVGC